MRRTAENEDTLQVKVIYDGAGNPEYEMKAAPGAAYNQARWRIKKLFYGTDGNYVGCAWASGTEYFDKVATDYAGYTYTPDPSA